MTTSEQFFYDNAGYSYNPQTETRQNGRRRCAVDLAYPEECAQARGWEYEWMPDDDPDLSFVDDWDEYEQAEWNSREHEVLGCVLKDADGKVLASLWGIVDATREYGRVVEAELASEALGDLTEDAEESTLA